MLTELSVNKSAENAYLFTVTEHGISKIKLFLFRGVFMIVFCVFHCFYSAAACMDELHDSSGDEGERGDERRGEGEHEREKRSEGALDEVKLGFF